MLVGVRPRVRLFTGIACVRVLRRCVDIMGFLLINEIALQSDRGDSRFRERERERQTGELRD